MAAALIARDVEDLVHTDPADVARGHELIVLGDDQESGPLERGRHLRHGDAGQPELIGEPVEAPQAPSADMAAPDEVHELERELLELDAREAQLLEAEAQIRG